MVVMNFLHTGLGSQSKLQVVDFLLLLLQAALQTSRKIFLLSQARSGFLLLSDELLDAGVVSFLELPKLLDSVDAIRHRGVQIRLQHQINFLADFRGEGLIGSEDFLQSCKTFWLAVDIVAHLDILWG